MKAPARLAANLTHDCGAKFQVAFEDVEQPYTCTGCGVTTTIESETLAGLLANFGRALTEANRRRDGEGRDVLLRLDCHTGQYSEDQLHG